MSVVSSCPGCLGMLDQLDWAHGACPRCGYILGSSDTPTPPVPPAQPEVPENVDSSGDTASLPTPARSEVPESPAKIGESAGWVECPVCKGQGTRFSEATRNLEWCERCHGRAWIPLESAPEVPEPQEGDFIEVCGVRFAGDEDGPWESFVFDCKDRRISFELGKVFMVGGPKVKAFPLMDEKFIASLGSAVLWLLYGGEMPQPPGELAKAQQDRLPCASCGEPCTEFSVPNDIWNAVIRTDGKEHDREYLCVQCFAMACANYVELKDTQSVELLKEVKDMLEHGSRIPMLSGNVSFTLVSFSEGNILECLIKLDAHLAQIAANTETTPKENEDNG